MLLDPDPPIPNKTEYWGGACLAIHYKALQGGTSSVYTDSRAAHFDRVDVRPRPGAAKVRITCQNILMHRGHESGDFGFGGLHFWRYLQKRQVEGDLRHIPSPAVASLTFRGGSAENTMPFSVAW